MTLATPAVGAAQFVLIPANPMAVTCAPFKLMHQL
jgi:hypothetical protein